MIAAAEPLTEPEHQQQRNIAANAPAARPAASAVIGSLPTGPERRAPTIKRPPRQGPREKAGLGGQAERLEPFLNHLRAGESEDWSIKVGQDRILVDSPKGLGLPKRCYCIRAKQPVEIALDEPSNDNKATVIPSSRFG